MVVGEQGSAIQTPAANVRRLPESEWNADHIFGMRAVPWSPDGSDNAFDIPVGMERPAEMVPLRSLDGERSSEDVPSQTRLRSLGSQ